MKKNKKQNFFCKTTGPSASTPPVVPKAFNQVIVSDTEIGMHLPVNMNNNRVRNVAMPIDPMDAVNAKFLSDNYVKIGDSSDKALFLSLSGGTMRGSINMNNNNIIGLPTPTSSELDKAANINYVNNEIDPILNAVTSSTTAIDELKKQMEGVQTALGLLPSTSSIFLQLAGGTMTGNIDMSGNAITNMATPLSTNIKHGANVEYVINAMNALQVIINNNTTTLNSYKSKIDGIEYILGISPGSSSLFLKIAGGTMTGAINMNNNKITNVPTADPAALNEAANVDFVIKNSPTTRSLATAMKQASPGGTATWNPGNYNYTWASTSYIQSDTADTYITIANSDLIISQTGSIWIYWVCNTVNPVTTNITLKRDGVDYYTNAFSNTTYLYIQCFLKLAVTTRSGVIWIHTDSPVSIKNSSWSVMKM